MFRHSSDLDRTRRLQNYQELVLSPPSEEIFHAQTVPDGLRRSGKKAAIESAPYRAENSSRPIIRMRKSPKPPCVFSSPARLSAHTARVKRCDGIPVSGSRHPYISAPAGSGTEPAAASSKATATPTIRPFVEKRKGANLNPNPVPLFVQRKDMILQCAAIAKSGRYGATISRKNAALRITMWQRLAGDLSDDFVRRIARYLFCTPVPKADTLLLVEHVNTNRQVLEREPADCRIFEKVRHVSPVRLSAERAGNFRGAVAAASEEFYAAGRDLESNWRLSSAGSKIGG